MSFTVYDPTHILKRLVGVGRGEKDSLSLTQKFKN